jgi:hypothetical protein
MKFLCYRVLKVVDADSAKEMAQLIAAGFTVVAEAAMPTIGAGKVKERRGSAGYRHSAAAKRMAKARRSGGQVVTPALLKEMQDLRAAGHSMKEIGKAYNYSPGYVSRLLGKGGEA